MKPITIILLLNALLLGFLPGTSRAEADPLSSPTWGFSIDLPPDYTFDGGDGKDRFSFSTPEHLRFDLVVYADTYDSVEKLAADVSGRLQNRGETSIFEYNRKKAALMQLDFADDSNGKSSRKQQSGWGFCVELDIESLNEMQGKTTTNKGKKTAKNPLLLALSYGPEGGADIESTKLSTIDSIAPSAAERRYPGPVSMFTYPRENRIKANLSGLAIEAFFAENDEEAAQALIDREYAVWRRYASGKQWQSAWVRFYRAIYRDSWDRLADAAFLLERYWNAPQIGGVPDRINQAAALPPPTKAPGSTGSAAANKAPAAKAPVTVQDTMDFDTANREYAGEVLSWIQDFTYERNHFGSDFVNLVSAVKDGRGDCDSRAMLLAVILSQSCIPSGIMVSRQFSHAMTMTDLKGAGARFPQGNNWLVAETTAPVAIGMISQDQSEITAWLAVLFE